MVILKVKSRVNGIQVDILSVSGEKKAYFSLESVAFKDLQVDYLTLDVPVFHDFYPGSVNSCRILV